METLSILNSANFKDAGARVYSCPATLATEKGCIEVSKEDRNNPGTYLAPLTSGTAVPCDTAQQNFTVRVVVKYKMRITIPLWASPTVTATGTGVFRCE
jgi:hypothetical protein